MTTHGLVLETLEKVKSSYMNFDVMSPSLPRVTLSITRVLWSPFLIRRPAGNAEFLKGFEGWGGKRPVLRGLFRGVVEGINDARCP